MESTIRCTSCNMKSVVFDHFTTLSLEVPSSPCHLQALFNMFTKTEKVQEW